MIISASRRTDLPAAHADWLARRFREGFVLVRNPMNPRQVSRVSLKREDVDGIVFWTKNPEPMFRHLDVFQEYPYYFQFTLTGYGTDVESNLPHQAERIKTFLRLAYRIGPERVLWRYDPILINPRYHFQWHVKNFQRLAFTLKGATRRVTISFVDTYPRNKTRLKELECAEIDERTMRVMAWEMAAIARQNGMQAVSCAEAIDLEDCGVSHASCVDAQLLGRIAGVPLKPGKDPNQRPACGCAPSTDIGAYNTCPNGCKYCYANYSAALLKANLAGQDDFSPILCGGISEGDRIRDKKNIPMQGEQLRMEF